MCVYHHVQLYNFLIFFATTCNIYTILIPVEPPSVLILLLCAWSLSGDYMKIRILHIPTM